MMKRRSLMIALSLFLIAQGCFPARTIDDGSQTINATPTVHRPSSTVTSAPLSKPTVESPTEPPPTPKAIPSVRVTAINGNLYIRRGPGTEYNRIGLLKNGESAQVIGQDMLGKWVQVQIPGIEAAGWVSLLTPFSRIDGDLSQVESFTFTDWPQPAYIKNCTEHDLIIGPNELYLYNLFTNSIYLNEVQVDPGVYDIYDLFLPGEPKIQTVDVQEGEMIYITVDGSGVYHNCP